MAATVDDAKPKTTSSKKAAVTATSAVNLRSSASVILIIYGIFLLTCGALGFLLAGMTAKAKTSLIMGGASGALMILCGLVAGSASLFRHNVGKYGGVFTAMLFAVVFAWRLQLAWNNPAKVYLVRLLAVMCVGSMISVWSLVFLAPLCDRAAVQLETQRVELESKRKQ